MRRLPLLLLATAIAVAALAQKRPTAQTIIDNAVAKAAKAEKSVFVVFHSPR